MDIPVKEYEYTVVELNKYYKLDLHSAHSSTNCLAFSKGCGIRAADNACTHFALRI